MGRVGQVGPASGAKPMVKPKRNVGDGIFAVAHATLTPCRLLAGLTRAGVLELDAAVRQVRLHEAASRRRPARHRRTRRRGVCARAVRLREEAAEVGAAEAAAATAAAAEAAATAAALRVVPAAVAAMPGQPVVATALVVTV